MQLAYKVLSQGWTNIESLLGSKLDNGVTYHIEIRGANTLLCESIDMPTGKCGVSITEIDITPVGNNFYVLAEGNATINISCNNTQNVLPTPQPMYLGNCMHVGDKYYKCVSSREEPYFDYELTNDDDIETLTINNNTFDSVGLSTGVYNFTADIEDKHYIAETIDGEIIELHRDDQYDTDVEFYYTYLYEGVVMRAMMLYDPPEIGEHVFPVGGRDAFAYVSEIVDEKPIWYLNNTIVNLEDYGIDYSGSVNKGDGIIIYYTRPDETYQWSECNE